MGHPERFGHAFTGTGLPEEPGSSIKSRASVELLENSRLVTWVFRVTVILACGMLMPAGVGAPPEHLKSRSPTSSVIPSLRTVGGTATLAIHCRPRVTWPAAIPEKIRIAVEVTRVFIGACSNLLAPPQRRLLDKKGRHNKSATPTVAVHIIC